MRGALARLAALLVLLALIASAGAVVALPLLTLKQAHDETVAALRRELAGLQRVGAQKAALEQQLDELQVADPVAQKILAENTASLAAAALQSRVKGMAERSGCALTSTQVRPAVREAVFERISLRLQMGGDALALHRFMTLLAADNPAIFVDTLEITLGSKPNSSTNDMYAPVRLQWVVEIYAYRRGVGK